MTSFLHVFKSSIAKGIPSVKLKIKDLILIFSFGFVVNKPYIFYAFSCTRARDFNNLQKADLQNL